MLTAPTYRIAIDDPDNDHEVRVTPADQLRAEVEGNRRGLVEPARQGVMLTLLWLWAAARRLDLVSREERFDTFVDHRLVAWERVKPDDPDEDAVPPTREAELSTSASSSAPGSPGSTGSPASPTIPASSHRLSESSTPTSETP